MSNRDRKAESTTPSHHAAQYPSEHARLGHLEQKLDALIAYTSRLEEELKKTQHAYAMAQEMIASSENKQQQTAEQIASAISYLQHLEASLHDK